MIDSAPPQVPVAPPESGHDHWTARFSRPIVFVIVTLVAMGVYLAYTIPHANNEAKNKRMEVPDLGEFASEDWPDQEKAKAAMIARLDRDVGRLMALLKKRGIDDNTLVFFPSDNGPHREGGADPDFFDSNGPLRGIKRDLYEGGIRVPMIARWPKRIKAGAKSDQKAKEMKADKEIAKAIAQVQAESIGRMKFIASEGFSYIFQKSLMSHAQA